MARNNLKPLTERGQFWLNHIHQWMQSESTQTQYCRHHELALSAFGWWRRRLVTQGWIADDKTAQPGNFLEVPISGTATGESTMAYEIQFPNQRQLRVPCDFDAEAVSRLVAILDGPC